MRSVVLSVLLLFVIAGCRKQTPEVLRSYYMGFTPWPADFTPADVDSAYWFLQSEADMLAHHFDEGIPYAEAYADSGWPAALEQEIAARRLRTPGTLQLLLSSSALSLSRKTKAPYSRFSENISDAQKVFWENLAFDDPRVAIAYSNYVIHLAETLQPAWINYGVESNEAGWSDAGFEAYLRFLQDVYRRLKNRFPGTPVMVSVMVAEQPRYLSLARSLLPVTDYIALSAYPYTHVSSTADGNTDPGLFPANLFTRFIELDLSKPFCFAETGYIAQSLDIPAIGLRKTGTPAWQDAYLQLILRLADQYRARFLVWFCSKDYDAGNERLRLLGLYQDLFAFWQDTGLKDEKGTERPALFTWRKQRNLPLR